MTSPYRVEISQSAAKKLRKLDNGVRTRIVKALKLLAAEPRPSTMKALTSHPGYLRVRVGDHRIVYTVRDDELLVLVLKIAHRREVYDRLP